MPVPRGLTGTCWNFTPFVEATQNERTRMFYQLPALNSVYKPRFYLLMRVAGLPLLNKDTPSLRFKGFRVQLVSLISHITPYWGHGNSGRQELSL